MRSRFASPTGAGRQVAVAGGRLAVAEATGAIRKNKNLPEEWPLPQPASGHAVARQPRQLRLRQYRYYRNTDNQTSVGTASRSTRNLYFKFRPKGIAIAVVSHDSNEAVISYKG